MSILVTGGAGYIGSHTVVQLLEAGELVVVVDNLSNSHQEVFNRIRTITSGELVFVEGDLRDAQLLDNIFKSYDIDSVIHFAGYKAVGESVSKPLMYYQNNILSTLTLLEVMQKHDCNKLVFSSSATVYGDPETVPITEQSPLSATNPYGQTKLMIENILKDMASADANWRIAVLRYFNPVGAHSSGLIGEDPNGIPNNLMPFVAKVAVGQLPQVNVFGDDYDTPDGTGVRDYIHVVDLAAGHLAALNKLKQQSGWQAYNLGTGKGYSVLDVINSFADISEREIPYQIAPRRAGDIATCYASVDYSKQALNWQAKADIKQIIKDHWNWQQQNPNGYKDAN
ncbi:MAG: UDP-glucose 4-epimerase GalE [Pseudomonadales bacterium]|nr:UDP-glucose 4-epimerase GalE [Pseudomonadales bacterium]NRA18543.1 UDP-glucose 4-epimerase GalE [Oceanospirillaceae bacterium]